VETILIDMDPIALHAMFVEFSSNAQRLHQFWRQLFIYDLQVIMAAVEGTPIFLSCAADDLI